MRVDLNADGLDFQASQMLWKGVFDFSALRCLAKFWAVTKPSTEAGARFQFTSPAKTRMQFVGVSRHGQPLANKPVKAERCVMLGGNSIAFDNVPGHSGYRKCRQSPWWRTLLHLACAVPLLTCVTVPVQGAMAAATGLSGVWLMGAKVAIQIFDCSGMMCGRVVWLQVPLDSQGLLKRDKLNPDPALRQRQVCGPTIIWNLRATDPNQWEGGWFYNPDDGKTYRAAVELESADVIVVRIYLGLPIFGETRTFIRVPRGISEGWS